MVLDRRCKSFGSSDRTGVGGCESQSSGVATGVRGGAGRTGRHLPGAAKRRKTPKIKKKIT